MSIKSDPLSHKVKRMAQELWKVDMNRQLLGSYIYLEGVVYPEGSRLIRPEDLPKGCRVLDRDDHKAPRVEDPNRITLRVDHEKNEIVCVWFG